MPLFDADRISTVLNGTAFSSCANSWVDRASEVLVSRSHGDLARWIDAVDGLPRLTDRQVTLSSPAVSVAVPGGADAPTREAIATGLMAMHPWRKGPFDLIGVRIDSEWRSDLKWARIVDSLSPMRGRRILDVGSGNGYYQFRMLGEGAALAIGIDPTQLFLAQFAAINHFVGTDRAFILPMRSDEFNVDAIAPADRFDTVFSMGVYYHRRRPEEHLRELSGFIRPGGELVLETLVIDDPGDVELNPESRYAQMRNVWSLPSVPRLMRLLGACGFENPRLIDLTATTTDEQRSTQWMTFDSLANFLDPGDPTRTIEGYPAPLRACITATRPQ